MTTKQNPQKWGSNVQGDIYIARSSRRPAAAAPAASALGTVTGADDDNDRIYRVPDAERADLPVAVDLRPECPRPYDQGPIGSSVGQAVAAAIEFSRLKHGLPEFTPSRLFIYYNARVRSGGQDSDSGAYIRDALLASIHRHGRWFRPVVNEE
jgi:hypothetical protein